MFPVQITPAPYAFMIWGLIYAFLVGYVIVQLLPAKREHEEIKRIGPWFIISCLFNITWILIWQYLFTTASIFAMLGLLISLIAIYTMTRPNGWSSDNIIRWFVQIPFSIYLGWISVATIVNAAAVLYNLKWNGLGLSIQMTVSSCIAHGGGGTIVDIDSLADSRQGWIYPSS